MADERPRAFAELLRRFRLRANLSQDDLAERAGLSAKAISTLERATRRAPYRETVRLLGTALVLSEADLTEFEGAASRGRERSHGKGVPPLRSSNLPAQTTSFVGREREVEEIGGLLDGNRLVTVCGSGGIGKTRLALEIAAARLDAYPDGVWMVDLSAVDDDTAVVHKVALTFLTRLGEAGALASLTNELRSRRLLLVLDNCERVVAEVSSFVTAILRDCPHVTVLTTSRERIAVSGEVVYRVPTMPIPPRDGNPTASEATTFGAVALFVERARTGDHRFALTDENAGMISDICRRVDGIALAIEIVAARLPTLGLSVLHEGAGERLMHLSSGLRDRPPRQQTLLATIEWSYGLLDERERAVLRRLSVFRGGFTLAAAERVCSDDGVHPSSVDDLICSLADKSFVTAELHESDVRYSILDSTRGFAQRKLLEAEESARIARRHAEWAAWFADEAQIGALLVPEETWLKSIEVEFDNLHDAFEWALGSKGDVTLAGRIIGGLRGFWVLSGRINEGQRLARAALATLDTDANPAIHATLLLGHFFSLNAAERIAAIEQAIAIRERLGDLRGLLPAYLHLVDAWRFSAEYDEALQTLERCWSIVQELGLDHGHVLALIHFERGEIYEEQRLFAEASAELVRAHEVAMSVGDVTMASQSQASLANVEFGLGNHRQAAIVCELALEAAQKSRSPNNELYFRCNLAGFRVVLGELELAGAAARAALETARGNNSFVAILALQHLAAIAALSEAPARAARIKGYVDAWFERSGFRRPLMEQTCYEILADSLSAQLGDEARAAYEAEGAAFDEDQAFGQVLLGEALRWVHRGD